MPASVVDDYADQLIQSLTQWFSLPAWGPLHRALRLQPGLPLRLRIAPDLRALESLPWETLPFGRPLWRLPPQDPVLPVAAGRQRRARLLLLVGEENNLDLQEEVEALGSVARRDRLLLRILRGTAAGAAALRRALEEEPGWDALIFLGHTERDVASGGRLQLGDGTWISGASLEEPLRRAADRGLGLVLLNSCSGIDLAHRCLAAGVAWVQVFCEPVPSAAAAHAFLQLLRQLEAGHPFHQALTAAAGCSVPMPTRRRSRSAGPCPARACNVASCCSWGAALPSRAVWAWGWAGLAGPMWVGGNGAWPPTWVARTSGSWWHRLPNGWLGGWRSSPTVAFSWCW
ncbi:MAG: CHAT domain-containing protein [Cyanobacteriota bacterium]|nr:CHAT domain-containing protein [Cyanobacteriota bacterium]